MRRSFQNVALAVAGLAVACGLAEVGVRMLAPEIRWRPYRDDLLGWASDEYLGFDPARATDASVARLLFLGDSYLAGSGVRELAERFPDVLAARIPAVRSRIFAAGGWGTDQQLLAFMEKGKPWRPDLVVVAFCANNDLANILSNYHGGTMWKPYFTVDGDALVLHAPDGSLIPDWTARSGEERVPLLRSQAAALVRAFLRGEANVPAAGAVGRRYWPVSQARVDERYRLFDPSHSDALWSLPARLEHAPQRSVGDVSAYVHEDFELNALQWRLLGAILRRLRDEAAGVGAPLLVVLLPVTFKPQDARFLVGGDLTHEFDTPEGRFTFRAAEPRERLAELCARLGIPFFDPTPGFAAEIADPAMLRRYWPDPHDRHFSAAAHAALAAALEPVVRAQVGLP
jgi:lysophospholipase L1-like esterase